MSKNDLTLTHHGGNNVSPSWLDSRIIAAKLTPVAESCPVESGSVNSDSIPTELFRQEFERPRAWCHGDGGRVGENLSLQSLPQPRDKKTADLEVDLFWVFCCRLKKGAVPWCIKPPHAPTNVGLTLVQWWTNTIQALVNCVVSGGGGGWFSQTNSWHQPSPALRPITSIPNKSTSTSPSLNPL